MAFSLYFFEPEISVQTKVPPRSMLPSHIKTCSHVLRDVYRPSVRNDEIFCVPHLSSLADAENCLITVQF